MLAQKDDVFEETSEVIFNLNQDDAARYWCEAREEGQRIMRTYQYELAEKDSIIAKKDSALAEKDSAISEMSSAIAEKDAAIAALQAQIKELQK